MNFALRYVSKDFVHELSDSCIMVVEEDNDYHRFCDL